MYLTQDIVSATSGKLYGKKNDQVEIISDGSVAIVEDISGQRFPVLFEKLTADKPELELEEDLTPKLVMAVEPQRAKPKRSKSKPITVSNQKSMF